MRCSHSKEKRKRKDGSTWNKCEKGLSLASFLFLSLAAGFVLTLRFLFFFRLFQDHSLRVWALFLCFIFSLSFSPVFFVSPPCSRNFFLFSLVLFSFSFLFLFLLLICLLPLSSSVSASRRAVFLSVVWWRLPPAPYFLDVSTAPPARSADDTAAWLRASDALVCFLITVTESQSAKAKKKKKKKKQEEKRRRKGRKRRKGKEQNKLFDMRERRGDKEIKRWCEPVNAATDEIKNKM